MWPLQTLCCTRQVLQHFDQISTKKHLNSVHNNAQKNSYLAISPKISILGHVLLHNMYINVAIANILLYSKSLYDLPGLKYQKWPKFHGAMPKNQFFGHISKTKHFKPYVAS